MCRYIYIVLSNPYIKRDNHGRIFTFPFYPLQSLIISILSFVTIILIKVVITCKVAYSFMYEYDVDHKYETSKCNTWRHP